MTEQSEKGNAKALQNKFNDENMLLYVKHGLEL